ncbi:AraC family transcriptional activator of pobA [Pedobacter sp. UYP30]|uniref:helix-turn-helix domain-containing protein n=1 Tax=Pedobacter sp. UYP30 TaxID=1756400 RepID=UPI003396202C
MKNAQPNRFKTISQYLQTIGLPKPEHPLISVVNLDTVKPIPANEKISWLFDFYLISLKRQLTGEIKFRYGQQLFDFDEGILGFMSPNQILSLETNEEVKYSGWMLLVHPDFFWHTSLAKNIKLYDFFDYAANEALHLSEKEETMIVNILKFIEQEYHSNIDKFSDNVIIAQLELLFSYSERFYNRQFLTRKKVNHQILTRLEEMLNQYFVTENLTEKGLPSVQLIAETLNVSSNYLSSLLKVLTGKSTQQHIQDKLIDKAKEILSTTNLSVSEIAYQLGFEYSQSFSTLFKSKTNFSPLEFRQSFN